MSISVASRKQKGRKLQQWVRDKLIKYLRSHEEDIRSTSMGAGGEDVTMSKSVRKFFPFSIECKSLARVALYKYYDQADNNAGKYEPLVIIKANHRRPLAILDADYFLKLFKR